MTRAPGPSHRGAASTTGPTGEWDAALLAAFGLAAWLLGGIWASTLGASVLAGGHAPHLSLRDVINSAGRLGSNLDDPAAAFPPPARGELAGPAVFWPVLAAVWTASAWLVWRTWRWLSTTRHGARDGYAPRAAIRRVLGARAARSHAGQLRPSLKGRVRADQVAVDVGSVGRTRCWLPVEDSALLVAPPRAGKSSQVIIPALWDWPGPALVTSTKVDVLAATHQRRASRGPVWVLDPAGITGLASAGWDLVEGCNDVRVAQQRATAMVAAMSSGEGVRHGTYWTGEGASVLSCWLIAAAASGASAAEVFRWSTSDHNPDPAERLAAAGFADVARQLRQHQAMDPEPRSSVWSMATTPLRALLQPAVRAAFDPEPSGRIDFDRWLAEEGTIYLIGDEDDHSPLRGLLTAFVEATMTGLKRTAQRSPRGRLDPPVAVLLDEIANVAPLPQIPALMSVAGSQGIFLTAVLQSIAQAEARWGPIGARQLVGGATAKMWLAGISDPEELDRWTKLLGDVDEDVAGWSTNERGVSRSMSIRRRPMLHPAELRTLQPREALLVHRGLLPVRVRQRRAHEGRNAVAIRRSEKALLAEMATSR